MVPCSGLNMREEKKLETIGSIRAKMGSMFSGTFTVFNDMACFRCLKNSPYIYSLNGAKTASRPRKSPETRLAPPEGRYDWNSR